MPHQPAYRDTALRTFNVQDHGPSEIRSRTANRLIKYFCCCNRVILRIHNKEQAREHEDQLLQHARLHMWKACCLMPYKAAQLTEGGGVNWHRTKQGKPPG
jgi:hypothetical protein